MRRLSLLIVLSACAPAATSPDAAITPDAAASTDAAAADAGTDAGDACAVSGIAGRCISTTECAAMAGYQSTAGYCPGAADIQCCTPTPDVSSNPPIPTGYRLMMQSEVTTAMTDWAVMILHDPVTYPMFSTAMMTFGSQPVLARVEWHPPDFNNGTVHRGVTLYVPL